MRQLCLVAILSGATTGPGAFEAHVRSALPYNLGGSTTTVQMVATGTEPSEAAFFGIELADGTRVGFEQTNGQLIARTIGRTPFGITAYDPQVHEFWRLRGDSEGVLHFETSSDGTTFDDLTNTPMYRAQLGQVKIELGITGSATAPHAIVFAGVGP